MLKILKYLNPKEWLFIAISIILICVQVWLDLRLPDYMSEITRLVQTDGSQMVDILESGAYMLACAIGSLLTSFIIGFFAARVAAGLTKTLRHHVYEKTLKFSMEEMNNFSASSLITRSTNDITQVQTFIAMGLQAMVKAPIMATYAIIKIVNKNLYFTAATGISVILLLIIVSIVITFAVPKSKTIQKLTDDLNLVTREHLTGLRVIKAYSGEAYQKERFNKANDTLANTNIFVNRITSLIGPYITFIASTLTLLIYFIGASLIDNAMGPDRLTIFSDMVVFSSYAMQIIMSFMMLTMIFIILPRSTVAANRILEVINTPIRIVDGHLTKSELVGCVEFKDVSFAYPDGSEDVLSNISFKANKGETVAIIGSTGSGKSTLINLIPRFYDVTDGEILVDGVNVKDYTQATLRDKISYISQKAIIFSGTIESNINFGEKGLNSQILDAAVEISQAKNFVDKMGLDGRIAQNGTNLSGGQKQRLSIARAIAKNPEIYIFDDSFSALDYKTDKVLRQALNEKTKEATKIIIAQRIGTIKDADKILVLDQGELVGIGTHKELLENCEVYLDIAKSQLSEEELAHV